MAVICLVILVQAAPAEEAKKSSDLESPVNSEDQSDLEGAETFWKKGKVILFSFIT